MIIIVAIMFSGGFPGGSVVINLPVNARDKGDVGSIPRLGRSSGGEMATYSSILAWKIPGTEETGGLLLKGSQRVGHDWVTEGKHTRWKGTCPLGFTFLESNNK